MGSVPSCDSKTGPSDAEAKSVNPKSTAFRWYGLHVLSAKCSDENGNIYYTKEINIAGIVAVSLFALMVLFLVFKMMHKKQEMGGGMPAFG